MCLKEETRRKNSKMIIATSYGGGMLDDFFSFLFNCFVCLYLLVFNLLLFWGAEMLVLNHVILKEMGIV